MLPYELQGRSGRSQALHTQSQDVNGSVMVSTKDKSAGAFMNPDGQVLLDQLAALRAPFGCVPWIHEDHLPTGPFCLVGGKIHELFPGYILDAFVEFVTKGLCMIVDHILDIKVFKTDDLITIYEFSALLVSKVSSLVRDTLMSLSDSLLDLLPSFGSFKCYLKPSLLLGKFGLVSLEEPRVINLSAIRHGSEGSQTNIDADHLVNLGQDGRFKLTSKYSVPLACRSLSDIQGLDLPFNWYWDLNLDQSDSGETEFICNTRESTCWSLWISKTIISIISLKPWVAWLFAILAPTKECLEGKINPVLGLLQGLRISIYKKRIVFLPLRKHIRRIVQRDSNLQFLPGSLACLKCLVVDPATGIEAGLQGLGLLLSWIQSVFERFLCHFIYKKKMVG